MTMTGVAMETVVIMRWGVGMLIVGHGVLVCGVWLACIPVCHSERQNMCVILEVKGER